MKNKLVDKNFNGNTKKQSLSGQSLTEYMTLLILISLVSIAAAQSLGKTIQKKIKQASGAIRSGLLFKDVQVSRQAGGSSDGFLRHLGFGNAQSDEDYPED